MQTVPPVFAQALRELGLAGSEPLRGEPLTGGVSSDIWCIHAAAGPVCAKRALARLRVAADWQAPIERNLYEARWMRVADAAQPGCTPRVLGQHPRLGVLVMSWLPSHALWKQQLREGFADPHTAAAVGAVLARIHAHAAARPALAADFDSESIFYDIRFEPYLLATAAAHPALAAPLRRIARRTATTKLALVHGDISPKNIMLGPQGPVFLDAECAWYGDPAFDLAFCLNHLLLKCLWTPTAAAGFLAAFGALAASYLEQVAWEPRQELEARTASLLPGLFLARIDGKSPVEYVTARSDKERVRRVAGTFLASPPETLATIRDAWMVELGL